MATYEESGVNISLGDKCSRIAYEAAVGTFPGRAGMIGEPVKDEGGFAGMLDMGAYYLVQNDDGVGTKVQVAEMMGKYDTLGYDLLAMVLDDAVCLGAEPISVTNTLDVDKVNEEKIRPMMEGLKKAALEHKVVIPGGEIAELGSAVNGYLWNATLVGVVDKNKVINGSKVTAGDKIVGLHSDGFRSNGFSLVRHILKDKFGPNWVEEKFTDDKTWGEAVLTPSRIYSSAIMDMHGRFGEEQKVELHGVVHVTGGGIYENLQRLMKHHPNLKADLHSLPKPHLAMTRLMELGAVQEAEAYRTWNMGVGMILIVSDPDAVIEIAQKHQIKASVIGDIV